MAAFRSYHRSVCRKLLVFLSEFCHVDLYDESHSVPISHQGVETGRHDSQNKPAPRWPMIVLVFYIYAITKAIATLYFQYSYDNEYVRMLRLSQLQDPLLKLRPIKSAPARNSSECVGQAARVAAARERVKHIGSPYLEFHLAGENAFLVLLTLTLIPYASYVPLVKLRLIKPLDFYFLRTLVDEQMEKRHCQRTVQKAVTATRECSKNYMLNWAHRVSEISSAPGTFPANGAIRLRHLSARSVLRRQSRICAFLSREADLMFKNGELMPINRSPEWIDKMSIRFILIAGGNLFFAALFDPALLAIIPLAFGKFDVTSFKDALTVVELMFVMAIAVSSTIFYLCLLVASYPGQLDYITYLLSRLHDCVTINDELFTRYKIGDKTMDAERASQLVNKRLMLALLEFEIFADQFASTKRSFTMAVTTSTTALFAIHGITRLHMPYYSSTVYWLVFFFCIHSVIVVDSMLVPLCRIHHSGTKLYVKMSHLLAHTIGLNQMMDELEGHPIYSEHLVWRLRNILKDPHSFVNQFAAHAYSEALVMSWTGLFKVHYCYSLLLLSTFYQIKSWKTLLGERVDDPLGLYSASSNT